MENTEKKNALKPAQIVALLAILALNVFWLICRIILFTGEITVQSGLPVLVLVMTVIYALFDYRKPHGNLMRYLILFHVLSEAILLIAHPSRLTYLNAVNLAIIILSTYMAGRLNKYTQNVIISIVILILQVVNIYPYVHRALEAGTLTFVLFGSYVGPVSVWLAIAVSYLIRYRPHIEAGLADPE